MMPMDVSDTANHAIPEQALVAAVLACGLRDSVMPLMSQ